MKLSRSMLAVASLVAAIIPAGGQAPRATDQEIKDAFNVLIVCLRSAARKVDDRKSDASTIARDIKGHVSMSSPHTGMTLLKMMRSSSVTRHLARSAIKRAVLAVAFDVRVVIATN